MSWALTLSKAMTEQKPLFTQHGDWIWTECAGENNQNENLYGPDKDRFWMPCDFMLSTIINYSPTLLNGQPTLDSKYTNLFDLSGRSFIVKIPFLTFRELIVTHGLWKPAKPIHDASLVLTDVYVNSNSAFPQ